MATQGFALVFPRAGTGEIVTPLHDPGASGYSRRWVASRLDGADGAAFSNWADTVDPTKMAVGSSTSIHDEGGIRYARVAGATSGSQILLPDTLVAPFSVVLVLKGTEAARTFFGAAGFGLMKLGSGNGALQGRGTGAGTGYRNIASASAVAGLSVISANFDAAAPRFRWNATEGTVSGSEPVPGASTDNRILWGSLSIGPLDVAEMLIYPAVLDDTKRASVYAAMKAHYTAIP